MNLGKYNMISLEIHIYSFRDIFGSIITMKTTIDILTRHISFKLLRLANKDQQIIKIFTDKT